MKNYGCRGGMPHDIVIVNENKSIKVETCTICTKKFRWHKGHKGRVSNAEYLKAHVRNFAQENGATKRIFNKVYNPESCVIKI